MRVERTCGYDKDGVIVHYLVAYDRNGKWLIALPRYPRQPAKWWNGAVSRVDRADIEMALQNLVNEGS